jgi:hypothetical protein
VKIRLQNNDDRLRAGMSADVFFQRSRHERTGAGLRGGDD